MLCYCLSPMSHHFVYICSATENQIVNLLPLLQLDLERVPNIFMLVGRNDPPTELDKEAALRHISNFNLTLKGICKRESRPLPKCYQILNPPHDTVGWQTTVAQKIQELASHAEPVLNVTSGTRSMMFGAMLGIQDVLRQNARSWRAVIHLASPARTEQLFPIASESPGYLNAAKPLTLTDQLSLRSYREQGENTRKEREKEAIERAEFTKYLATGFLNGPDRMVGVLHRLIRETEDPAAGRRDERHLSLTRLEDREYNTFQSSGRRHRSGRALKELFRSGPECPLCRIDGTDMTLDGKTAISYFMGGWFEEYVFLLCRQTLSACNQVRIHLGVRYADSAERNDNDDGEIDVIIQAQNDLHIIECKSGSVSSRSNPDGVDRRTIHTIATRRRQIAGPTGSARLLSFQKGYGKSPKTLKGEARHAGVTIYFGAAGLREFRSWLSELAERMSQDRAT